MTYAEKFIKTREQLLYSQDMLAKELGVAFSTINRIERGHHEPNLSTKRAFVEFCKKHKLEFSNE
jgi:DNA-binding XRE family transcriptional regulator